MALTRQFRLFLWGPAIKEADFEPKGRVEEIIVNHNLPMAGWVGRSDGCTYGGALRRLGDTKYKRRMPNL